MRLSTVSVACLVASCCSYYVGGWSIERCTLVALVGRYRRESSSKQQQQQQLSMRYNLLPGQMRIQVVEGPQRPTAMAKVDIKEKDVLLSLPFSDCITVEKAGSIWNGLISAKDLRTGSLGLLALYILSEMGLSTRSRYHDYFVTLPVESPGILSWEASLVEELVQSTTRKVSSQLEACSRDIEFVQQVLDKLTVDEKMKILPVVNEGGVFSGDRFRWALGIVKSRYVVLNQQPAIVPGK